MNDSRTKSFSLASITIEESLALAMRATPDKDLQAALDDLQDDGYFVPFGSNGGPYHLTINIEGTPERLLFCLRVRDAHNVPQNGATILVNALRRITHEYDVACQKYAQAVGSGALAQLEAASMVRRSLHTEGGAIVRDRLRDSIDLDMGTARRLFTLFYALIQHIDSDLQSTRVL